MAKKRGPNSKYWRNKDDKAWSLQVREVGECAICEKTTPLNAHHLINRTRPRFRHDLNNGICLCVNCHMFGGNGIAAHGSQDVTTKFAEWMAENRPEQWKWFMENRDDKRLPDWTYEDAWWKLSATAGVSQGD